MWAPLQHRTATDQIGATSLEGPNQAAETGPTVEDHPAQTEVRPYRVFNSKRRKGQQGLTDLAREIADKQVQHLHS